MAAAGLAPGLASSAAAAPKLSMGTDMYKSIGVRPVINCKGTFTVMSGSLMLPECSQAMQQASQNFVQMDELMAAVGERLAEITGALSKSPSNSASKCTGSLTSTPAARGSSRRAGSPTSCSRLRTKP